MYVTVDFICIGIAELCSKWSKWELQNENCMYLVMLVGLNPGLLYSENLPKGKFSSGNLTPE